MALFRGLRARWFFGATLLYGAAEAWQIRVREYEVALANLPREAEGTRILQISDLHFGFWMPRLWLQRVIRLAAEQKPDVVVLTGDMLSRRNSYHPRFIGYFARTITDYAQVLAEELKQLNAPYGLWAVPGNHDLWNGSFMPISDILARANVVSLVNRSVRLDNGLTLVGLDDLRAGNPEIAQAFADVDAKEGHIVLSHNPRLPLLLRTREALILSGHTHAGQIRLPFFPAVSPVDSSQTHWQKGFYPVGHAQLYVSAGAGTVGIPVRLNVPPEIAVFTLRCK